MEAITETAYETPRPLRRRSRSGRCKQFVLPIALDVGLRVADFDPERERGARGLDLTFGIRFNTKGGHRLRAWLKEPFSHRRSGRSFTVPPRYVNLPKSFEEDLV